MTVHRSMSAVGAALLIAGALAACAAAGDRANSPPTTEASPVTTVAPTATVIPSTTSSEAPPTPEPTLEPPMPLPPAARIAVDGGDPVVGQLGTFTWQNSGSDSPWLDGSPIRIGSGEQLTLTLDDPIGIGRWTVSRVQPGNRDGIGAVLMAEAPQGPVIFDAPPAGTWSVEVSVRFADEVGTALYFWLIEVD